MRKRPGGLRHPIADRAFLFPLLQIESTSCRARSQEQPILSAMGEKMCGIAEHALVSSGSTLMYSKGDCQPVLSWAAEKENRSGCRGQSHLNVRWCRRLRWYLNVSERWRNSPR